jgi:hypothetical protein
VTMVALSLSDLRSCSLSNLLVSKFLTIVSFRKHAHQHIRLRKNDAIKHKKKHLRSVNA